jgi:hypothetical protein
MLTLLPLTPVFPSTLQVNIKHLLSRHHPPSSNSFVQAFDFVTPSPENTQQKFFGTENLRILLFVVSLELSHDDDGEEQQEETIEQLMLKYGEGLDGGVQETPSEAEDVLAASATE